MKVEDFRTTLLKLFKEKEDQLTKEDKEYIINKTKYEFK